MEKSFAAREENLSDVEFIPSHFSRIYKYIHIESIPYTFSCHENSVVSLEGKPRKKDFHTNNFCHVLWREIGDVNMADGINILVAQKFTCAHVLLNLRTTRRRIFEIDLWIMYSGTIYFFSKLLPHGCRARKMLLPKRENIALTTSPLPPPWVQHLHQPGEGRRLLPFRPYPAYLLRRLQRPGTPSS